MTYLRDPAAIYAPVVCAGPRGGRSRAVSGDAAAAGDAAGACRRRCRDPRRPRLVARRGRRRGSARSPRGAPILVDSAMVAAGIIGDRLPAGNALICTLARSRGAGAGRAQLAPPAAPPRSSCGGPISPARSWRSAMRRPRCSICSRSSRPARHGRRWCSASRSGLSAPPRPRTALTGFGGGLAYMTLRGRRGGSALAAAAVNALAARRAGRPRDDRLAQRHRHRR